MSIQARASALAFALGILLGPGVSAQELGTLRGTVLNRASGSPIAGAVVTLRTTAIRASDGTLSVVPNGNVQVASNKSRGRGRFTVRQVARATERAREFPTGQRAVVLDDSVFAPYVFAAWRAASGSASVTAIFPRGLRRASAQIEDLGQASTTLNHDPARLRHVQVTVEGQGAVHLWLDGSNRLMKLEIPSRNLTAERLAGS